MSDSAGVFKACSELDQQIISFLTEVLTNSAGTTEGVVGPFRLAWYGALTQWAQGLLTLEDLARELTIVADILIHGAEADR